MKLKIFYTSKGTIARVKVQPTKWEKNLCQPHTSEKGLILRIYEEP